MNEKTPKYIGIKCSTKPFALEQKPNAKHPLIAIIVKVRRYQSVDSTADENSFQKVILENIDNVNS